MYVCMYLSIYLLEILHIYIYVCMYVCIGNMLFVFVGLSSCSKPLKTSGLKLPFSGKNTSSKYYEKTN